MKNKINILGLLVILAGFFLAPVTVDADVNSDFNINQNYALGAYQGDSRQAYRNYIILHESGNQNDVNDTNAVLHEVQFMHNNYSNAYATYFVGGGGQVYQVGQPGYVAWGALSANPYSPVQIELARTADRNTFNADYHTYVNLARYWANYYGIPLTLDGYGNGIKSHLWVTNNYGGDHQDPYGYLASWGITKQRLAEDLLHGFYSTPTATVIRDAVTIKDGPTTGIAGWNSKGKIIPGSNTKLRNDTAWKTSYLTTVNGLPMYRIATDEYIPKKYTSEANLVTINAISGVNAVDSTGKQISDSRKTFTDQSKWKTNDRPHWINGKLYLQVATNQYIDTYYTIGGGNR
ncbi:N-acetylmuramoyl-L-alanine amidase [Companilactobacillus allii]|uniref:N-acetylmuramoyl-L-alanine amidase domain-containing protein n=1 Tax=Companilactobacillus allii TaxID=1847728 RepID=A0A1P8Q5G3_9LACO|nr:N-acetylmuramoyl-L-alanine amidase [Companilactobacillus allii]APX73102.1 hypothetical protein BTM29_11310 [Companilactobacillus allii]USQ67903.1 N-acetylmuramoyl-L-alanine amidase [Companilactobacillus allii]